MAWESSLLQSIAINRARGWVRESPGWKNQQLQPASHKNLATRMTRMCADINQGTIRSRLKVLVTTAEKRFTGRALPDDML